jgi:hypothetical protein
MFKMILFKTYFYTTSIVKYVIDINILTENITKERFAYIALLIPL